MICGEIAYAAEARRLILRGSANIEGQESMSDTLDRLVQVLDSEPEAARPDRLVALIGETCRLAHVSYFAPSLGYAPPVIFEPGRDAGGRSGFLAPERAYLLAIEGGKRFAPLDWADLSTEEGRPAAQGFTAPISDPEGRAAIFSVGGAENEDWAGRLPLLRRDVLRLAGYIHLQALTRAGLAPIPVPLDALEEAVLRDLARGLAPDEIAARHGVAAPTLRALADSVRHKLGALTLRQAVRIAACGGRL